MAIWNRQDKRQHKRTSDVATFTTSWDDDGATIRFEPAALDAATSGDGSALTHRCLVLLNMLQEQGHVRRSGNAFYLDGEAAASLNDSDAKLLGLPVFFTGEFQTEFTGNTTAANFDVQISAVRRTYPEKFTRAGAFLTVGHGDRKAHYRLPLPMMHALEAYDGFSQIDPHRRTETANVRLIAKLQEARDEHQNFGTLFDEEPDSEISFNDGSPSANGPFPLDLSHLEKYTATMPSKVRATVERRDDGSLRLTPDFGTDHNPERIERTLGQLDHNSNVLRVDNHIIDLEDDEVRAGVQSIRQHSSIPASSAEDFFRAPQDFLGPGVDGTIFSSRVKAVGHLEPMTFADATAGAVTWFSEAEATLRPEILNNLIETPEEFIEIEDEIQRVRERNGQILTLDEDTVIDVSDNDRVDAVLNSVRERTQLQSPKTEEETVSGDVAAGLLIEDSTGFTPEADQDMQKPNLDLTDLRLDPFSYQTDGIQWLVERMQQSLNGPYETSARVQGAVLADDMGLGKTFMTLVALRQFARQLTKESQHSHHPHLLVVPLTLVENWKAEMERSFVHPPFDDVLILHGAGLNQFRRQGYGRETLVSSSKLDAEGHLGYEDVSFSLMVGERAGDLRLDVPGRLVITTYETLSNYQLSLGSVDWGVTIFDEAQELKNPETLRSRAARGLKARFKIVATGTPVENSLRDLWSLLDTAQPGFLGNWLKFKRNWVVPMNAAETPAEKFGLGEELADLIRPVMLRRTKEDELQGALPPKTIHNGPDMRATMPPAQRTTYDQTLAELNTLKGKKGGVLAVLGRLRRVSLHPYVLNSSWNDSSDDWQASARIVNLMNVLDVIRGKQEKAIIFVSDKVVQRRLAEWLRQRYRLHVHIINGDTKSTSTGSGDSRREQIQQFEGEAGFNLIIMSPIAAGRGLTVTGANHAVHLERHWNPAKEAQATDRIYRIGQELDVHIYLPMAIHPEDPEVVSFDVSLHELLEQKTQLKNSVIVPEPVREEEVLHAMKL